MRTLLVVFLIGILNYSLFAEELVKRGERRNIVESYGKSAAKALKQSLKSNLVEKMQKEGPIGALQFCANEAQHLTALINKEAKAGIRIKRVSREYRNPVNEPDKLDNMAYDFFIQKFEQEKAYPANFIARLRLKENKDIEVFRYYEPLIIEKPCLVCHGENIKPDVAAQLKDYYPKDLATGYKLGDLRGLIAVEVTPDALVEKKK